MLLYINNNTKITNEQKLNKKKNYSFNYKKRI